MGNNDEIHIVKRALEREKNARKQAEKILEDKSRELYSLTQKLKVTNEKLEDLIGKKESELQGVFHNLVDAYVLIDLTGNVLEMNNSAQELFGYDVTKESLNLIKLIYKEDYDYAISSFKKLVTTGSFSDYQARILTKNKEVRIVHINASLIFDKNKKPIAAQGIVRDTTEELTQKRIFEEQKNQLSAIVENSSLGIVLTQFGKILQTNIAFQSLLGYTSDEIIEKEVKDISIKEEYSTSNNLMKQLNDGIIDNFSINKRYVKKDGTTFWAKTNVAAVRNNTGDILYQVALIEDITEHLEHEKQKEELLQVLEKSNQELHDYAHVVSHDLKSPLRSINALVTWIKEDYHEELKGNGLENIALIEKTLEKMESLISGILNYSGIGNKESLDNKEIDVNTIIENITTTIFIPDHVSITLLKKLPTILGDPTRIRQLFQNILTNAVSYIDKEKGIVEIDYLDKGSYYMFSIKDNGIGIEKKYHEKIFKIFQSLGTNKHSSGVGLSIVKKIIDLYEGDVWIDSESGKGTTFFFTLKK